MVTFGALFFVIDSCTYPSVLLIDELNPLLTPKQDVVHNLFNWLTLVGSKLVIITLGEYHLPEWVMAGREESTR